MPGPRRNAFFLMIALAALGAGGIVVAQMEAGDRGILPIDSSGTLEVGGIHVDVGAKTGAEARLAGWRIAQRQGFRALWAKSHGRPLSEAPNLSDSTLDGLVSSIIVEREQIGPKRYIADLGILFDRARAGELLGVGGQVRRSAPMLLIPIMVSGGSPTTVELRNPWQRAWAQYRTAQSPIDYVRVSGMGVDPLLVNAAQSRRPGRGWWRNILDLYGAANVLVAEVRLHRLYPGGPSRATFIGTFGPNRRPLGTFELTAKDSADLPRMMAEGVQRMDQLFGQALAAGIVRGDPSLIIQPPPAIVDEEEEKAAPATIVVPIQLLAPNPAWLSAAVAQLRAIHGIVAVEQRSVAYGGVSMVGVTYRGTFGSLANGLAASGWQVVNLGGMLRLTPAIAPPRPSPAPQQPESPSP